MKERPILMTSANAQKCFDGTKTQTRRIVKPQPPYGCEYIMNGAGTHALCRSIENPALWVPPTGMSVDYRLPCPYGIPVDKLWVREPHAWPGEETYLYRGKPEHSAIVEKWRLDPNYPSIKWTPSIHMKREACRTVLEIVKVRVERLQEISEADALAEIGELETVSQKWVDDCKPGTKERELAELLLGKQLRAKLSYMNLWESINGDGSWALNPWVWVIEFKNVA